VAGDSGGQSHSGFFLKQKPPLCGLFSAKGSCYQFSIDPFQTKVFLWRGGLLPNNLLGVVGTVLMGCTKLFQLYEFLFLGVFIIGVNCDKCTILIPCLITLWCKHSCTRIVWSVPCRTINALFHEFVIWTFLYGLVDRLCGLVVRLPDYRSRGPGSIPGVFN
jgi:hypothetical protein